MHSMYGAMALCRLYVPLFWQMEVPVCQAFGRVEVDIPVAMILNTQNDDLYFGCSMPIDPCLPKVYLIPLCYLLICTCLSFFLT
uniref:Uncharacterized protein n=1 Tax=Setaria viridis TaxID=4556 RepID=A0A4U6T9S6_SETVI|nr:hypothetical protein SEVIR_9G577150v2 [Setaria viridis]